MSRLIQILLPCALVTACGGQGQSTITPLPVTEIEATRLNHAEFRLVASPVEPGLSYEWALGDGTTYTGPEIRHRYGAEGAFEAAVTVRNQTGEATTAALPLHVRNTAPVADFGARYEGLKVTLDASASFDVDRNISSYDWVVNGDHLEGAIVEIVLDEPGELQVSLTVTDDFGLASENLDGVLQVTGEANTPPQPLIDTLVNYNYVRLLAANSSDADGDLLSYRWILSDGSEYTGDNLVHAFPAAGTYTVTLRADDGETTVETMADVVIEQMDDVSKPYRQALYEASLDLLRRCGYCHRDRDPQLGNFLDLDVLDAELTEIVLLRSPFHVYSFPSEQNGLRHRGVIGGRVIDAGDIVRDQLDVWHRVISGIAEYHGLEHNF